MHGGDRQSRSAERRIVRAEQSHRERRIEADNFRDFVHVRFCAAGHRNQLGGAGWQRLQLISLLYKSIQIDEGHSHVAARRWSQDWSRSFALDSSHLRHFFPAPVKSL